MRVAIDLPGGDDEGCDYRSTVLRGRELASLGIENQHIEPNNSLMIGCYIRLCIVSL